MQKDLVLCRRCLHRCHALFDVPQAKTVIEASIGPSCSSCLGLYPSIDPHATGVVAAIRNSPYEDSEEISINVGLPRILTFSWLISALSFRDQCEHQGVTSSQMTVVPESFSNFKEFYGPDVRGHVITELRRTTGDLNFRTKQPLTLGSPGVASGIMLDLTVLHSADDDFVEQLPQSIRSTRSDVPLTWKTVADIRSIYFKVMADFEPFAQLEASISHAPLLLIGRYRKMLRDISQSPWFFDGKRVGSTSLQEMIAAPILPLVFPTGIPIGLMPPTNPNRRRKRDREEGASESELIIAKEEVLEEHKRGKMMRGLASPANTSDPLLTAQSEVVGFNIYKFHAAGREDVDVRMLGSGRPFVLEITSPHRERFTRADFIKMEEAVNSSVGAEIENLGYAAPDAIVQLARHSEAKKKTYKCVVWCSRPLATNDPKLKEVSAMTDILIKQKTPMRVLHRRSLLTRDRLVHSVQFERINDHWLIVSLETQAGTYVKEFVHGDMGRTVPSLATLLGGTTDIIQLDVADITMEDDSSLRRPNAFG